MPGRKFNAIVAACCLVAWSGSAAMESEPFVSPSIVVLGDSQLAFGAGRPFLEFFEGLAQQCALTPRDTQSVAVLDTTRVAVLGVRASSLESWTARAGPAKGKVCEVDPNWDKNAGTYGVVNRTDDKYVQIGTGEAYQFCEDGKSPFEAMLRPGYYRPGLLVMSFLGLSARRWTNDPETAIADVAAMNRQLPDDLPCVYLGSAPTYREGSVATRSRAQALLQRAFAATQSQCSFVAGVTPETIAANQGNPEHFRRNEAGKVIDPFHPNAVGSVRFLAMRRGALCEAIVQQLRRIHP